MRGVPPILAMALALGVPFSSGMLPLDSGRRRARVGHVVVDGRGDGGTQTPADIAASERAEAKRACVAARRLRSAGGAS